MHAQSGTACADECARGAGAAGYVEPERYELKSLHRQLRQTLCCRCRALAGGQILPAVQEGRLLPDAGAGVATPEELRAQLEHITNRKALVVQLVDLTDVAGTLLPRLREIIGPNPVILLGTKLDLLPKGTDYQAVVDWLARVAKVSTISVRLVSAKTGDGLASAVREVADLRNGRDVYVLGAANVGKSQFISAFLEHFSRGRLSGASRPPLSSKTPGTTLALMPFDPFSGGSKLYDTPGVSHDARRDARRDARCDALAANSPIAALARCT